MSMVSIHHHHHYFYYYFHCWFSQLSDSQFLYWYPIWTSTLRYPILSSVSLLIPVGQLIVLCYYRYFLLDIQLFQLLLQYCFATAPNSPTVQLVPLLLIMRCSTIFESPLPSLSTVHVLLHFLLFLLLYSSMSTCRYWCMYIYDPSLQKSTGHQTFVQ